MHKNRYRITVEALDEADVVQADRSFSFTAASHDELSAIVARARAGGRLEGDEAAAMAVGLKLLGEVVLAHRQETPFSILAPHIGEFIKQLKAQRGASGA